VASALKAKQSSYRVYTLVGDGEIQEGLVWEAAREAAHRKLDNLIAVLDNNTLDISGKVLDQSNVEPIAQKFSAFGWKVIDRIDNGVAISGHRYYNLKRAFEIARDNKNQPVIIIANTEKGKGFPPYEDDAAFHGVSPKENEFHVATELINLQKSMYEKKLKSL